MERDQETSEHVQALAPTCDAEDWDFEDAWGNQTCADITSPERVRTEGEVATNVVDDALKRVRTDRSPISACEPARSRFEMRLTSSQLARWRTIAAEQNVTVAELVRFAVEYTANHVPAGFVRTQLDAADYERVATGPHARPVAEGSP